MTPGKKNWASLVRRNKEEDDLGRSLVESLYASPASLAIGALAGLMLSLAIAAITHDLWMIGCSVAISLIAVGRTVSAIIYYRKIKNGRTGTYRHWELAYELGAWVYAGMLGAMALTTLLRFDNPAIHLLSVSLATGYAGGIAGRNAGRVKIAVGQTCLSLLPTALGLWLSGDFGYRVLSVVLLAMVLGMAEITRTTHRIVVKALRGNREKTLLAAKYERLARYDNLTGVENRMAMQMRLRYLFDSIHQTDGDDQFSILWIDLDRFKEVNDSLGHMVGDALLLTFVERLQAILEDRGYIARFGGDEFVVLCPGMSKAEALTLAGDMLSALELGVEIGGHNLSITASVGVAAALQDGNSADELMQNADMALYEAKALGRNRVAGFVWSMKDRFRRVREIERGLRSAIDNDEMQVWYQPIFELKTGHITICEALLRWDHPTLGPVSPGEFIPIAESIGMIETITHWVIRQACYAAAGWPEDVRVAINISPVSFRSGGLPAVLAEVLLSSGIEARRVELEVTETIFMHDDGHTHHMLRQLRDSGLRLVLDDFGTGYSSLSYLRSYHFDGIKIDRSFIQNITESHEDQAIVNAVSRIAGALGMEIVAEGIETQAQLSYALQSGIHNIQGYLMSKALPLDAVNDMIRQRVTIDDAVNRLWPGLMTGHDLTMRPRKVAG